MVMHDSRHTETVTHSYDDEKALETRDKLELKWVRRLQLEFPFNEFLSHLNSVMGSVARTNKKKRFELRSIQIRRKRCSKSNHLFDVEFSSMACIFNDLIEYLSKAFYY